MDLEELSRTVERIRQRAAREGGHLVNPTDVELRPIVEKEPGVNATKYGKMVVQSEPKSRAAMFPQNSGVKIIRNSNYIGVYKKGAFASENRMAETKIERP
jgi:hypothetical protein